MTQKKIGLDREVIAMRVARELPDGSYVNLGIGIPTLVSNYVVDNRTIIFQAENGVLNYGPAAENEEQDVDLINAGGQFLKPVPGMSFFDSAEAFAMIRGGHIDITILGALQVSEQGDLANWMLPTRGVGNIGGAMDLAVGADKVIIAMEHTDRNDQPKIVTSCTYPLTAVRRVSLIVTDVAVIEVGSSGLVLKETAPGWSIEEIQSITEPVLIIPQDIQEMTL